MKLLKILLLAQLTADPITGASGWFGAGLLGLVLSWLLLKHLPDKDKQVREMQTACDAHNAAMVETFTRQLDVMRNDYKESLKFINDAMEKRSNVMIEAFVRELRQIDEARSERKVSHV